MHSICKMLNDEGDVDVIVETSCAHRAWQWAMILKEFFPVEWVENLGNKEEEIINIYF